MSAAPGLEVRTSASTPAPALARCRDERLERVGPHERIDGHHVGAESRHGAERRGQSCRRALGRRRRADVDIAALAVGDDEQAGLVSVGDDPASAAHPGAPGASKRASWGLTATHAGPAASISAAAVREHGAAAAALGVRAALLGVAPGHSVVGSGSSPRTICDSRRRTSANSLRETLPEGRRVC